VFHTGYSWILYYEASTHDGVEMIIRIEYKGVLIGAVAFVPYKGSVGCLSAYIKIGKAAARLKGVLPVQKLLRVFGNCDWQHIWRTHTNCYMLKGTRRISRAEWGGLVEHITGQESFDEA